MRKPVGPARTSAGIPIAGLIGVGVACLLGLSHLGHQGTGGVKPANHHAQPPVVVALVPKIPLPVGDPATSSARQISSDIHLADFAGSSVGSDVRVLANWIADTTDAHGRPFAIVDKAQARVYLFDGQSRLQAESAVLLGAARGDDSVPGIGERPIALVKPQERTTPAGRFPAEPGRNAGGEDIIWVDYDAAVSMHRVRANNASERRLQRLTTPTAADNRISYGCINVPAAFYDQHVKPLLTQQGAVIYVVPEVRSVAQVFGAYDVVLRRGLRAAPAAA